MDKLYVRYGLHRGSNVDSECIESPELDGLGWVWTGGGFTKFPRYDYDEEFEGPSHTLDRALDALRSIFDGLVENNIITGYDIVKAGLENWDWIGARQAPN